MNTGIAPKWFALILLYFFILITITTGVTKLYEGGDDELSLDLSGTAGELCYTPRLIYEPYTIGSVGDTDDLKSIIQDASEGNLECEFSYGTQSNESCSSIPGCEWGDPNTWIQILLGIGGEETCVGTINVSGLNTDENTTTILGDTSIKNHDNEKKHSVCTHPLIISNETACDQLGCTWTQREQVENLVDKDTNPSLSMLKEVWSTIRGFLLFEHDFGMESPAGSAVLNLIVFWFPLILMIIAIYQLLPIPLV